MASPVVGRARSLAGTAVRKGLRTVYGPRSVLRTSMPEPVKSRLRTLRRHLPTRVVRLVDSSIGKRPPKPVDPALLAAGSARPEPPGESVRVWVAPANFAGQGKAWADALTTYVDGVGARSMAVEGAIRFAVDQEVHTAVYRDVGWQKAQEEYVFAEYTHVLIEAERPVFGTRYGSTCEVEIDRLRDAGLTVGLISHGSDLRIPSRHAQLFEHSPFDDPEDTTTKVLEARARNNSRIIAEFDGPVFVSTPDLLDYAPKATWCPTVVDTSEWTSDWPLLRRRVPRVVHIPSNGKLKGSGHIDEIVGALAAEGLVEYRRPSGVTRADIQREFAEADIVIDQLVMGLYGVTAIEALAGGRVVVAFLGDAVRERVREAAGVEVPMREATVETLRDVILDIVENRDAAREFAAAGPAYAASVHDGRMSARVLTALTGGTVREQEQEGASGPTAPPEQAFAVPALPNAAAGVATCVETPAAVPAVCERPVPDQSAPVRLFVGPADFAGQGTAWARAAEAHLPGVSAISMSLLRPGGPGFSSDYVVDPHTYNRDAAWGERQQRYLCEFYSHVLIEAGRKVTGMRSSERSNAEVAALREAGVSVAHLLHGTDVRLPRRHAAMHPHSPFADVSPADWTDLPKMEQFAAATAARVTAFDGPVFVSTPDLLAYAPGATWCPVVVDAKRWAGDAPVLERERPAVAHVPSSGRMKGSDLIDPVLWDLDARGVIEYRRGERIAAADMPGFYRDADIVLDQFVIGAYGVAGCEAMAAGRVVLAYVTEQVRSHVREAAGVDVPIVEADPDTLAEVLAGLLDDRDAARAAAAAGPGFVCAAHDGRLAAKVLGRFLGA